MRSFFHLSRFLYEKLDIDLSKIKRYDSRQKIRLVLIIILMISITVLLIQKFKTIQRFFVLVFFVVLNFLFAFFKRRVPLHFIRKNFYGAEFIMLCTLASSVAMGPGVGAAMGPILMIVNYLAERRSSDFFIITIVLYSLIGYLGYYFKTVDFIFLGITTTLIYNVLSFFMSKVLGAPTKALIIFSIVNIMTNIFLFTVYGTLFLDLLA